MKNLLFICAILLSLVLSCSSNNQTEKTEQNSKKDNSEEQYDGIMPIVSCRSIYYQTGQDLEIDIFFNRKINHDLKITFFDEFDVEMKEEEGPDFTINDEYIHLTKKNLSQPGAFIIKAKIFIVDGDEEIKSMDFKYDYSVGRPSSFVEKEKKEDAYELILNKENTLNAGVIGYPKEDLQLTTNNGEISEKDGKWIIRPEHQGNCTIKIKLKANEETELGEHTFKVIVE